jgi:hypothetical protein
LVALNLRRRRVDLGVRFVAVSPFLTRRPSERMRLSSGRKQGNFTRCPSALPAIGPPMLGDDHQVFRNRQGLSTLHIGTAAAYGAPTASSQTQPRKSLDSAAQAPLLSTIPHSSS